MPQETNEKRYGAKKELAEHLRGIVLNLPETPGCYQYLDETGKIIYVGKAKNLKRRVSSYFNKEQQSNKTRLLVTKIRDIRYVVVKTEEDALLLENNLIKRYKPHLLRPLQPRADDVRLAGSLQGALSSAALPYANDDGRRDGREI